VGVRVGSGICMTNLNSPHRLSGQTEGQTDMARSTRLVTLIKNIYTLWGQKSFLLPVTYFPTNLVYPFTLPFRMYFQPKRLPHNFAPRKLTTAEHFGRKRTSATPGVCGWAERWAPSMDRFSSYSPSGLVLLFLPIT